ncbi:hypothetical protein NYQ10_15435 [Flavobacterium johnsoniae]|uniref:Uncharacterized protein n=3 Tax=Flavobacterium TaxID=237 RepID=A0A1M5VW36_FLAJO|nr:MULTISPECIES: hypothetical protein [Flavobacterium]MBZ4035316.1 hypothetical protein [Flavobacterium potami]WJS93483.1 hypothetical protein NYQ10_15435 [Flavobacterium johnsoniae]SHG36531.1 hypothetical protein SAMN05443663_102634 [Flavobacterium defluvii]SHH79400.1 hypothetical protein SAMN05444388_12037 [Flavobacterium johnsoniae]
MKTIKLYSIFFLFYSSYFFLKLNDSSAKSDSPRSLLYQFCRAAFPVSKLAFSAFIFSIGWDISGEIVEKTEGADGFEVGEAVFALSPNARGYAEYVAVKVDFLAKNIRRKQK